MTDRERWLTTTDPAWMLTALGDEADERRRELIVRQMRKLHKIKYPGGPEAWDDSPESWAEILPTWDESPVCDLIRCLWPSPFIERERMACEICDGNGWYSVHSGGQQGDEYVQCDSCQGHGFTACPNTGGVAQTCHLCECKKLRPKISWIIVGGESGHGARACDFDWIRSIVQQCKAADVPVFVKQVGLLPIYGNPSVSARECYPTIWGPIKDPKGGNSAEWPCDLRVREFPA